MRAAPWVDKELLESIGLRSKYSREWRYARKRREPKEIVDMHKRRYLLQKSRTATLTGDKKSNWEEKRIAETWGDAKAFWKMIKDLLGKNKEETKEACIFTEEGEKKEIKECRREFMEKWTSQVYQKLKKADFSFWYDRDHGQKQEMINHGEPCHIRKGICGYCEQNEK